MINIFENNNAGSSSTSADFLHSMSDITFILSSGTVAHICMACNPIQEY